MISTAKRLHHVQEYYFSKKLSEIAQLNANGHTIINLGIGSPDMAPPQQVVEELCASAVKETGHGYQSYKGIPALRQAFCGWYQRYYNVILDPDTEVLPLMGSKEGITYISTTYLDEGDEVLVPNPGYPAYAAATKMAGGIVRYYDLIEENNWLPDLIALQEQDLTKVKLMWVNYPHMPTGAKATTEVLKDLVAFAERNGILLCHDNPYSFILNDAPQSILSVSGVSEHVLELNSLSKSHNMAGWRVGMVAGHSKHIHNILISKSNVDSGMLLATQQAAVKALEQPQQWYDTLNESYSKRRDVVWQMMEELGCNYSKDQAGLFVWGRVDDAVQEVAQLVDDLLYQAGVFITPGFIFGTNGDRFIRISLCSDPDTLQVALDRIKNFKV